MSGLPKDRRKGKARPQRPAPVAGPTVVAGPKPSAPAIAPPEFPKVHLFGGPSPADTYLAIDGQPPKRGFGVTIETGVDMATRVQVRQYAEIDVRLTDATVDTSYTAVVRVPKDEGGPIIGMVEAARGEGPTLVDAVRAAAKALAKAELKGAN